MLKIQAAVKLGECWKVSRNTPAVKSISVKFLAETELKKDFTRDVSENFTILLQ